MSSPGLPTEREPFVVDPYTRDPRTGAVGTGSTVPTGAGSSTAPSTAQTAKDEAAGVASQAADSGKHVAGVAKDQAADVVGQAKDQAKDLLGQTRAQLGEQTTAGQARAASGLGSLAAELRDLAEGKGGSGIATDLARQAGDRVEAAAGWLRDREPADVLRDVQTFARRRPVAFLAIAAGAGLVAGRLTRGLGAVAHDAHQAQEAQEVDLGAAATGSWTPPSPPVTVTEPVSPVYGGGPAGAGQPASGHQGWDGPLR